jgi:hypothetical protein
MYEIEATVTETGPTVLKLTADWPVDWLRATGIRTMEIQRKLSHGEILEPPLVPVERREIDGNRGKWRRLHVGNRVVVRCYFPGKKTEDSR